MKKLGLFLAVLVMAGCSSTTSQYYEAGQRAADGSVTITCE